jgi:Family of unknown function (DUF6502)
LQDKQYKLQRWDNFPNINLLGNFPNVNKFVKISQNNAKVSPLSDAKPLSFQANSDAYERTTMPTRRPSHTKKAQQINNTAATEDIGVSRVRNFSSEQLLDTVMLVMRPLVRLLLARGVVFTEVVERLKRLFVDVANHESARDGQHPSDSRIAVMTGVHRKDVKRFREEDSGVREPKETLSLPAQVLYRWSGDSRFMKGGQVRPLRRRSDAEARTGKRKREGSFDDLVEAVSKDLPVRAILDDWIRLGIVRMNDDNEIVPLDQWSATMVADEESFLTLVAVHGYDRLSAAVDNFMTASEPHAIFSVDESGLSPADVAALLKIARPRAKALLNTLNERAVALKESHKGPEQASMRVGMGFYLYSESLDAPGSGLLLD